MKLLIINTTIAFLLILSFNLYSQVNTNEEIIQCIEFTIGCRTIHGDGKFVIKNNDEYIKLLENNRSPHPDCINYELPYIDFNQNTLIGYESGISGCDFPTVSYQVMKTDNNYIFKINIIQKGNCKRSNLINTWCLIPKIENESMVEFKINIF